jgi:small-conductance mechanosensitive channel
VTRELRARIKEAFDAAGIEIPQRTVWHRAGDGAVAVLPPSVQD